MTDNAPALASETAERFAARIWNVRHALVATPPGPAEAVTRALAAKPGSGETPVVLVDLGDNIGGGSAADSTVLIHELIRQGATGVIVVLYDPAAVQNCAAAGVGGTVTLDAGGKDDRNAPPLQLQGRVNCLHDGRYVEELPRHGGNRINDQGLTAVVETSEQNTVVLNSRRHPPFSLGQLTSLGLVPQTARVLVVKAAVAYKAAYGPIAGTIIPVDTPGLTAVNPARYTYHKIRRPILPLDPEPLVEADPAMSTSRIAPVRIAAVQMDVALGEVAANRDRMLDQLEEAAGAGARLIVFPECALTGYGFASRAEALAHAEPIPGPSIARFTDACA